jgi:ribosome-associated protein
MKGIAPAGELSMSALQVTPGIVIGEDELEERFVLASGPGGQNVNKVATAVQLRFDAAHSPSLPDDLRPRLMALAGRRLTREGVIVLIARNHRTQERNRQEARERLAELIRQAAIVPKPRRATRPTLASKKRRLDSKTARSKVKQARAKPAE